MCLILDTNRFSDALSSVPPDPRYAPLLRWLLEGDGVAVFGGQKFRDEIQRVNSARRFFVTLERAGKALPIDDTIVDQLSAKLAADGKLESDDEHVLALAIESGARVVCTEDQALMNDVKNPSILSRPRGRVYREETHVALLHHDGCCGQRAVRGGRSRKKLRAKPRP